MPTISFHPDGSVEFTRNRHLISIMGDRGIMERVSEIHKFRDEGSYYIRWLKGPYKDWAHSANMANDYGVPFPPRPSDQPICAILQFPTYEAAVEHEIAMLDAMRKAGVRFRDG